VDFDCVVIGAGVVGLAVGHALSQAGFETLVAERAEGIGTEVSSRNSEVIHAGIYYPEGSLKAKSCRRGRDLLYEFCQSRKISHRKCGKLVVATNEEEIAKLDAIYIRAHGNGVTDMTWLDASEAASMEPEVACVRALWSPSTGIIDSHSYMLALQGEIEASGGAIVFLTPMLGAKPIEGGLEIAFGGAEATTITTRWLINAAGLSSQEIAAMIKGFPQDHIRPRYLAKGSYFNLAGSQPFNRLIYPAPVQGGLGVHVTIDLAGQVRFGPDVEWLESNEINYEVDLSRADSFYAAIRRYWPALKDGDLVPAYSGVRPKISGKGQADEDFRIDGPEVHGQNGIIHMFGIESPGLTASLALGDSVLQLVKGLG
jgi:L-2-hydroxyglutarate oxidase LhgO